MAEHDLRRFDAADFLAGADDKAALLNESIADGDPHFVAAALGAVARRRGGIAKLATETGLTRQALNKALGEGGNPRLDTLLKVVKALGLELRVERVAEPA